MFAGPVFFTELITSARRTRFFLWRVAYATVLLLVLVTVYLGVFGLGGADTILAASLYARAFFHSFAVAQLLAVLFLGPALAAGAIARERERRTIEYLFTTHLTDAEIIGHKFLASIVQLATAVLVGLPVLSLAMLMGGISVEHLVAAQLITLSTIGVVVALSLAASVVARRARDAVVASYAMLLLWLLGPGIAGSLLSGSGLLIWIDPLFEWMSAVNPLAVLSEMLSDSPSSTTALGAASERWEALAIMALAHAGTVAVALVFCWWGVRRFCAGEARNDRRTKARTRKRAPGRYAVAWREMHAGRSHRRLARAGRGLVAILIVAAVAGSCWQYYQAVDSGRPEDFAWFQIAISTLLACCSLLLVAAWAASSIGAEREGETWLTLVSTPVTAREVLAGKIAGSMYAARGVLIPLTTLWILAALADVRSLTAVPVTLAVLLLTSLAASVVGVGFSLWCSTSTRALGATLGLGLFVTVLGTCCMFPFGMINPAYLLAFPGVVNQLLWEADWNWSTADPLWAMGFVGGMYLLAWVVGMGLYLGLVCLLWTILVQSFDRLAGRIVERPIYYVDQPGSPAAVEPATLAEP